MSLAGDRRRVVLYFCVVALLIVPMSQIWLCRECCKAGAARLLRGDDATWKVEQIDGGDSTAMGYSNDHKKSSEEEFFDRFFNGRNLNFNQTEKGFEESKRRVPSCPDPLHN
ncbi:hypothetical protein L484_014649 [Morus notabilis]|uniref:CLAVATA3/ESR (CLE)-related protein 27 n=1 Tax=Morus notabilis TaxID=981085 RepID=W9RLN6_9ROSA|nr:CLAVATA3/ESR (CLE)-related protein 43 [Morus notabilis]EXB97038.1 hypothetical protein L484_014649 [Morus notabilis]